MVDVYKTPNGFYFQTDNYDGEASNAKEAAKWLKDNGFVRLQAGSLDEAKKKKAKKKDNRPIGKPMRSSSGGKAYKVYVKDPKTKKIKTVRFGSGGLRAKINDSKARAAFAKRHKCSTKKDRIKKTELKQVIGVVDYLDMQNYSDSNPAFLRILVNHTLT